MTDMWHIRLNTYNGSDTLAIFPRPIVIHRKGLLREKIRAYHTGGAVDISGNMCGNFCIDHKFPSSKTIRGLVSYLPVEELGFSFEDSFSTQRDLSEYTEAYKGFFDGLVYSLSPSTNRSQRVADNQRFFDEKSESLSVSGYVKGTNTQRVLEVHDILEYTGARVTPLQFSTQLNSADLTLIDPKEF